MIENPGKKRKMKQGALLNLIPERHNAPATFSVPEPPKVHEPVFVKTPEIEILATKGKSAPKVILAPPVTRGQENYTDVQIAIRVDFVTCTLKLSFDTVFGMLNGFFGWNGKDWQDSAFGSFGYTKGKNGPGGAVIWWDAPNRIDVCISLPGDACGMIDGEQMSEFLVECVVLEAHFTRVDVALDDFKKEITPEFVHERIVADEAVTYSVEKVFISDTYIPGKNRKENIGATQYIGAPDSRQRIRVYNKFVESKGKINSIRWELQCRDEAAESLAVQLGYYREWGEIARRRFITFVDFRKTLKSGSRTNQTYRERADWYESLMGRVEKIWVYPEPELPDLEDVYAWIDRSVAPSLSMVLDAEHGDWSRLLEIIKAGRKRYKSKHKRILSDARNAVKLEAVG